MTEGNHNPARSVGYVYLANEVGMLRTVLVNKSLSVRSVGALLAICSVSTSLSVAPVLAADFFKAFDFRTDMLNISGGSKSLVLEGVEYVQKFQVSEGKTINVSCNWSAVLAPGIKFISTDIDHTVQVVIKRDSQTLGFGPAKVPKGTKLGSKEVENDSIMGTGIGGSSTTQNFGSSIKGTLGKFTWTATGVGQHKFECVIPKSQFIEPTLSNNITTAYVDVVAAANIGQLRQQQTLTFEAEDLVRTNRVLASRGQVVVQPMASFGSGWSGNEQLFWTGGDPGASIELTVSAPKPGTYSVELYATRAPDYGDMIIKVNSQPSSSIVEGYAPSVLAPVPLKIGDFKFAAGANTMKLTIIGKSAQSSGFFAGIDRIRLHPVNQ